jgi:hypothetical protein
LGYFFWTDDPTIDIEIPQNKLMKKLIILISIILGAIFLFQCKAPFNIANAYSEIIGAWAQKDDENVDFTISENKIEYFETGYFYNYKITKEKDLIITDSNKVVLKFRIIKLSKDNLII